VTFNGNSFDLPVLRYRAMVHGVSAQGLSARPYFHQYTEDAIDLCDVFSSFSPQGKASLHEISKIMGLLGKPKEVRRQRGGAVLPRGQDQGDRRLLRDAFEASQQNLADFHECACEHQRVLVRDVPWQVVTSIKQAKGRSLVRRVRSSYFAGRRRL